MEEDAVARMTDEEIERLANRLAMLVSPDGESDNAGRAVGALARRLGLSGGQLKAIFLAGAESAGGQHSDQAAQIARLRGDLDSVRETLRRAESAARSVTRERDALRLETGRLRAALDGRRGRRLRSALAVLLVLVVLGGAGWLALYGPTLHLWPSSPEQAAGTPTYHTAVVRDTDAVLRRDPDSASPALTTLPSGSRLIVRRVVWHDFMQWVEVQSGDAVGYVMSTEVELS
jgi:hypothetical protein